MLFDFAELPPRERYKLLVSTITPRPIAWIVSQSAAGRLNAAPFSLRKEVSAVSHSLPPLAARRQRE